MRSALASFGGIKEPRDPGDLDEAPGAVEIKDGDVVSCRIDGFEPLSNPVVRR